MELERGGGAARVVWVKHCGSVERGREGRERATERESEGEKESDGERESDGEKQSDGERARDGETER